MEPALPPFTARQRLQHHSPARGSSGRRSAGPAGAGGRSPLNLGARRLEPALQRDAPLLAALAVGTAADQAQGDGGAGRAADEVHNALVVEFGDGRAIDAAQLVPEVDLAGKERGESRYIRLVFGRRSIDKASQNSCDTSCDVSAELPGLILFTNLRFSPSQETRTMPTPD